jgi:hypothetical protein
MFNFEQRSVTGLSAQILDVNGQLSAAPPLDCRKAGAPVDCRISPPLNSRT